MRVLLVTQYFWPESFRINALAKTLAERGLHIEVLTGKPNYPGGEKFPGYGQWGFLKESHEGVQITRLPMLARKRGGLGLIGNYLSFIFSGLLFAPWLFWRQRFDVIFVYAPSPILQALPAIFLGWIKGIPVVLWVQDLWPDSLSATGYIRNRSIIKLTEQVVRFIYHKVDLLLVQSSAFIQPVRSLAGDTPIVYYPNSVEEAFATTATTAPRIKGQEGFSILFAGNIGSAQAVEVIVEAAAHLTGYPDINFLVLGEGSRWEWMKQEVGRRGLSNVHLPGRFPIETMPGFMQRSSALLVTLADQEIFKATIPSKIQAYLAAGRPILACLNGEGARLITEARAGLATPAEDGLALSKAVLELYHMPKEELDAMGARGRAYCKEHFEHNKLVDQLIEHLQSAVSDKEKKK
jgi:glycosyltransferase involved in cell wall biosynthesis